MNPAKGQDLAIFPFADAAEVEAVLASSRRGFQRWQHSSICERVAVLTTMAEVLRVEARPLMVMITDEMGKPITQARHEVLPSARTLV